MATGNITVLLKACNSETRRRIGNGACDHARAAIDRANEAEARGDVALGRFWARVAHHWERVAMLNLTASITGRAVGTYEWRRREVFHAR